MAEAMLLRKHFIYMGTENTAEHEGKEMKKTKVALVQMSCEPDTQKNLEKAAERIAEAAKNVRSTFGSGRTMRCLPRRSRFRGLQRNGWGKLRGSIMSSSSLPCLSGALLGCTTIRQ